MGINPDHVSDIVNDPEYRTLIINEYKRILSDRETLRYKILKNNYDMDI